MEIKQPKAEGSRDIYYEYLIDSENDYAQIYVSHGYSTTNCYWVYSKSRSRGIRVKVVDQFQSVVVLYCTLVFGPRYRLLFRPKMIVVLVDASVALSKILCGSRIGDCKPER